MSRKNKLKHLLKPGEFRIWCRPNDVPGDFDLTSHAWNATCANCLTAFRAKTQGIHRPFRVRHVAASRKLNF